jgi:hypothetical protein
LPGISGINIANRQQVTTYIDKIRTNGGIIIELDGVQPEKGNKTLWILKDHKTEETLLAKNLLSADKNAYSHF